MSRVLLLALVVLVALASAVIAAKSEIAPARYFATQVQHDWVRHSRASPHDDVELVFAVRQKNVDLEAVLEAVSNPLLPTYGQHLSIAELTALLADEEAVSAVQSFLRSHGVHKMHTTLGRDFIKARCPVAVAEKLLQAEFYEFSAPKQGHRRIKRTAQYTIPEQIADHVDFVGHTVAFPPVVSRFSSSRRAPRQSNTVTPQFLWAYYNISNTYTTNEKTTQSVYENLNQYYNPDDLSYFQSQYNLESNPIAKVVGKNDPSACQQDPNNCIEATLDVEYLMAIAQNASTTFWSIASEDEPFLDWITAVADDSNPPLVHSVSYGSIEDGGQSKSVMQRFDSEVTKMGIRGLSIIIASGDDGVANFIARDDASKCGFNPSYPATSPHVTAVGASMGPEMGQTETACTSAMGGGITTGGGFSTIFARPSYQDSAVQSYLSSGVKLPPSSRYHGSGRGYPDVATLGHNYNVIINREGSLGSGTSASAPVFAGMISLINDERMNRGKSPLGFLNIALYQLADSPAFRDLTKGENNCCAGDPGQQVCCQYGFYATQGWDPLTGLGGVNYPNLFYSLVSNP